MLLLLALGACGGGPTPETPTVPVAPEVPAAPATPTGAPTLLTPSEASVPASAPVAPLPVEASKPAPEPPRAATTPAPVAPLPADPTPSSTLPPSTVPDPPGPAATPVAVTYTLQAQSSSLYVQVFKDPSTAAAGLSHDHVVAAAAWTGTVRWGPADCAVRVSVPVSGLRNDEDPLRKRVGYTTTLTADQRAEVRDHMLGASQLDADRFPTITFAADRCDPDGTVHGELTMHGRSVAVAPKATVAADGAELRASGTFSVAVSAFGFQPYTALLGALKNLDVVRFTFDVRGRAAGG